MNQGVFTSVSQVPTQAKVHNFQFLENVIREKVCFLLEHDVGGLNVSMHYVVRVHVAQTLQNLLGVLQGLRLGLNFPFLDFHREVFPRNVF